MNATQIDCFLSLAETHSFTRTAEQLYLSQQAVSKYIGKMEEETGVQLFDRSGAQVTLTAAGLVHFTALSAAKGKLNYLKGEIADFYSRLSRQFSLGFSDWIDPFGELDGAVEQFRQAHRGTRVSMLQLSNLDLIRALLRREVDVAFFSEAQVPQAKELTSCAVARGEISLFAPADAVQDRSPDAVRACWGLPLLMVPAWDWSYLEQKIMGHQEQGEVQVKPERMKKLPNVHSLMSEMKFGRYAAVSDRRFGILTGMPELDSCPLNVEEHLVCVWRTLSEHPLIASFVETMQRALK